MSADASAPKPRWAALARDTNETKIQLALNLDGGAFPPETDARLLAGSEGHASQASRSQTIAVNTGIGFLDHMLHALAKHAGWSLAINCKGDLHSKSHTTARHARALSAAQSASVPVYVYIRDRPALPTQTVPTSLPADQLTPLS